MRRSHTKLHTLLEVLRHWAGEQPEKIAYSFLGRGLGEGSPLTFGELDRRARSIGATLQDLGVEGQRAILLLPPPAEFVAGFFGCLYAGVVPVPAPPVDGARLKRSLPRLRSILQDSGAQLILTVQESLPLLEQVMDHLPELASVPRLATNALDDPRSECWRPFTPRPDDPVYIQYTSGSTSTPKGVVVAHHNLLANCASGSRLWGYDPGSVAANWMPYHHDYGLVEGFLRTVYDGIQCYVLSPLAFLRQPVLWLQVISRFRVTHSAAPTFAYDLCVDRIPADLRTGLDLSCWRTASIGAEVIRPETLQRFVEAYSPFGFRSTAFHPSYGLAEATLLVSSKEGEREPTLCTVEEAALAQGRVVEAPMHQPRTRTLVGCGRPDEETQVVLVDPETATLCAADQVGEIWVAGPGVSRAYWNRPEESADLFGARLSPTGEGPFLRTGDLGFLRQGELFVAGRRKELIILHGENHYPQDIERTVERSDPALRLFGCAAFSVDSGQREQLVVVAEVHRSHQGGDLRRVEEAVRAAVTEEHDLGIGALVLIRQGGLPKTSSGKIQRAACREAFLQGHLEPLGGTAGGRPLGETPPSLPAEKLPPETGFDRAEAMVRWLRGYAEQRLDLRLMDERRSIPPYVVLDFGNQGVLGLQVSERYGGPGLSNQGAMRVLEQLGAIDVTLAVFVVMNNALGIRPIERYAPPELRDALLPLLARGRELASFALTEPGAGSNPRSLSSVAEPDGEGGWRLQGRKIWSGSSSWAGVINVFVQHLGPGGEPAGISGFCVRQGTPGLRMGAEALTMGIRGMVQNAVELQGVQVSAGQILGVPGAGMEAAQDAMMFTRLCLAAVCLGAMRRCARMALRYAERRHISTGLLLDNPFARARLAELTAAIAAVECLVRTTARFLDEGKPVPEELYSTCKVIAPELLWRAADDLMQLLGGRGYMENNQVPQIFRDARSIRIFEGPTETLHLHLGSRVFNHSQDLERLLQNELEAGALWDRLREEAESVAAASSGPDAPFPEPPASLHWTYLRVGEVAAWAVMLAVVEKSLVREPSLPVQRAAVWCRHCFEEALARSVRPTPAERVLLGREELKDLVEALTEGLGAEREHGAGEERALDAWLQPESVAVPSPPLLPEQGPAPVAGLSETFAPRRTVSAIEDRITHWLLEKLPLAPRSIAPRTPFAALGVDSVTAATLAMDLEDWLESPVETTLLWDYPTIAQLARHLGGMPPAPAPRGRAAETEDLARCLWELEQLAADGDLT